MFGEFLTTLDRLDFADHVRKAVVPAAQALFDILKRDVRLSDHSHVRPMRRTINIAIKKPTSDMTIWPFEVFTKDARECQPPGKQGWPDLMGLAVAVFAAMVPCRPIALIMIDPTRVKARNDGQALTILAHEKMNFSRGLTSLTIRKEPEERLSPWFYFTLLARRSRRLRCPNVLFCSNRGQPYARADVLG
jgi:hypothetical protein